MSDRFKIDNHKLNYHPDRVSEWLAAGDVYPIYVEISPAGACNHRCTFCAVDYIGYEVVFLDKDILKTRLEEMGKLGIRSVMFAGEGEPLLHKALPEIIRHTKASGIDVAITTNAVPLTMDWCNAALESVTWIKVSINAGTAKTYSQIHKTHEKDFHKVLSNIEAAATLRDQNKWSCAIGSQMVLLPENLDEALVLAKTMKSVGCDYLVIKPYSQHNSSITREYQDFRYEENSQFKNDLESLNDDRFNVVFRSKTMNKLSETNHYYSKCYSTPNFWAYIMANGSVYGCSAYLLDEKFCYGNIIGNSFEEIWQGSKRRENIGFVKNELDIKDCRKNCRMDEVNRYLWDLKHPSEHVNFI